MTFYGLLNYCNVRLTELHWFYSPRFFEDSSINLESIAQLSQSGLKPIIVLDRNIFSKLINVATKGKCEEGSTKDIGILITFCILNDYSILPYYALNEFATGQGLEENAQKEYQVFSKLFKEITALDWMALAIGGEKENKKLIVSDDCFSNTIFNIETIDYLYNYAALLHFAIVWKTKETADERFISFFEWYYDNLKISRYMETYICSVLASCDGYKAPKKINSKIYEEVIKGCKNQARDISYLTSISIDRIPSDKYELILVSDDKMLGLIFEKGSFNTSAIRIYENVIRKGNKKISVWVDNLLKNHKEKEINDHIKYCKIVIDEEEKKLKSLFI